MKEKIVVFTGAGISAESGLKTFRDSNGLWRNHRFEDLASPQAYATNPKLVLDFYNERRRGIINAQPNAAHLALKRLEEKFDVVIVTQNIDDLHERAGSSQVIHLHGEILKGQSSINAKMVTELKKTSIEMGDLAADESQLRPHVVWFGEPVLHLSTAAKHFSQSSKVLTVGTSLSVFPAAGLVLEAPDDAEKFLVAFEVQQVPANHCFLQGKASEIVPRLVRNWLTGKDVATTY